MVRYGRSIKQTGHTRALARATPSTARRRVALALFGAGVLLIAALLAHYGVARVMHALAAVGWGGFALFCAVHLGLFVLMGAAWYALPVRAPGVGFMDFVFARLVRDAGSEALPLSQIGGYLLGGLALSRRGVPASLTAASTVLDVSLEVLSQIAFVLLGLMLLRGLGHASTALVAPVSIGIATLSALIAAFLFLQRNGGGRLSRAALAWLARHWPAAADAAAEFGTQLRLLHAKPRALALCALLHGCAWLGIGWEAWLGLRLLGSPLPVTEAVSLESLLFALRALAFAIPNAAGAQEAIYVLLAGVYGVTPTALLALSLLKRGRDALLGGATLGLWQWLELRRARASGVRRALD